MADDFLRKVSLFSRLTDEEMVHLEDLTHSHQYKKGTFIVLAEDVGDEFFIIRKGRVKVNIIHEDGREIILSLLGEGDVFGELSLLDGQPRSANVVAAEAVELITIRRDHFINLIYKHPHIATQMLSELAGRLRKTDLQIEGLALMNVGNRVSKIILNLVAEQGHEVEGGILLQQRPTHQELARMAGTTRETVTRVLSSLEKKGYLRCDGRRIMVFDEAYN